MREDGVMLLLCLFLLVCLPNHLLVASPSSSSFPCHPDQRHALFRFIHSFSITRSSCLDTSYPKVASWREDEDCCSWEGVACNNSTGDVIGLDLSCAGLRGSINSSSPLFSLRNLRSLSLAGNNFLGSAVPPEIGVFTQLEYLNLSSLGMSGILPTKISQLSKLVSLDLSDNNGLEMQDDTMRMLIQNQTQMEQLDLGSVDMSKVTPTSFLNLSNSLISLKLIWCSLRVVPNSIGNLSRLTYLDLSYNNFTGEFDLGMLSKLRNLQFLHLYGLSVSSEDADLGFSLPKLQELYMGNCNLRKFPSFLSRSKELRILDLWRNKIQEIPSWLGSIGTYTLEEMTLNNNNIGGSIPPSICQLASLSSIYLYGNKLTGVIPQCIGNLSNLQVLNLRNNSLSGPLPPSLANSTSLWRLDLSYNSISGAPPTDFFLRSVSLSYIDLSHNKFEGRLPVPSAKIHYYSISNNHFSGEFSSLICNAACSTFRHASARSRQVI